MSYDCKICGNFFSEHLSFFSHLKKCHNLSGQAYYDAYMKKSGEGVCEYCKKPTKYYGLGKGYARFCCTTCSNTVLAAETKSYELKCEVCDETIRGIGLANATKALVNHLKKNIIFMIPKFIMIHILKSQMMKVSVHVVKVKLNLKALILDMPNIVQLVVNSSI